MQNALMVRLTTDEVYGVYGGGRTIFFSIRPSETQSIILPVGIIRKVIPSEGGPTTLYLNPYCATKESDGKLHVRYEVVGGLDSSNEEVYHNGYEFAIPLDLIGEYKRC